MAQDYGWLMGHPGFKQWAAEHPRPPFERMRLTLNKNGDRWVGSISGHRAPVDGSTKPSAEQAGLSVIGEYLQQLGRDVAAGNQQAVETATAMFDIVELVTEPAR
jgi:hypothetical protein